MGWFRCLSGVWKLDCCGKECDVYFFIVKLFDYFGFYCFFSEFGELFEVYEYCKVKIFEGFVYIFSEMFIGRMFE